MYSGTSLWNTLAHYKNSYKVTILQYYNTTILTDANRCSSTEGSFSSKIARKISAILQEEKRIKILTCANTNVETENQKCTSKL